MTKSEPTPLVSIIITSYNVERYIEATLDSILQQTYTNWEVIVIDDGSTDETKTILRRWHEQDDRFKVFFRENRGRIIALNDAIANAHGDFIAIQDADDISAKERLQAEIAFLIAQPEYGMVGSFAHIINEHGERTGEEIVAVTSHEAIRKNMLRYNPFVHSSVMYRASALKEAGPYTARFLPGFEWEVYAKMIRNGWKVQNLSDFLVEYRMRPESLTRTRSRWKRAMGVTKARWFVYKTLNYPFFLFPLVLLGLRELISK